MSKASFTFKVTLPKDQKAVIESAAKEMRGGVDEFIMHCIDRRKEAAKRCEQIEAFREFKGSLDWIREYSGEYGAEVLAFDKDGSLFVVDGPEEERVPVSLAESVEWMLQYEYTGKLGIESEDHTYNYMRWLKEVAAMLRATQE